jgi:hypothetical protein
MAGNGAQGDAATAGDAGAKPAATKGKADAATATDAAAQPEGDQQELGEGGLKALEAEREARAAAQRELKEVKAQLKQLHDKDLPEAERSARELAELKAANESLVKEIAQHRTREAVFTSAAKLGFADPTDAFRLVDIELDADGKPRGVEAALTALLAAKPYLKSSSTRVATGGSADAGNNAGTATGADDMNSQIRRMAGRGN